MDTISQMMISIKNGGRVGKPTASFPYSNLKNAILECLEKEGYVASVAKKTKKGHSILEVGILYVDNKPKIYEVERISKPSKRVYVGVKDIFPVRNGKGLLVLSTPKGILTGKNAKAEQVGGEPLFRIW